MQARLATALLVPLSLLPASARAQERPTPVRLYARAGVLPLGEFGADVAVLGDLDGDGVGEWMAGRTGPPSGSWLAELRVYSGASGSLLYTLPGLGRIGPLFLETLADLGDVDGDGVSDFAFGNANAAKGQSPNVGAVVVYSGATGVELYTRFGIHPSGGFGASLAALGDVDDDGVPDFVAGAIGTLNENAWVVSGATGGIHLRVKGPKGLGDIEFGWAAAALGDVDGDGRPDFAIGTRKGGFVDAYSSASGALLHRASGGPSFGRRLASIGDVNGDGSSDLLAGEPSLNRVHVLSGRDGSRLRTLTAPEGASFGLSLAPAGDVDRDHVPDFLVGDPHFGQRRGRAQLFSGRSGRVLFEVVGSDPDDLLGAGVAGGAGLGARGGPGFVIGAPGADRPRNQGDRLTPEAGGVTVWSAWPARGG